MAACRWVIGIVLIWGTWAFGPDRVPAQQPQSDVFNSSGQYDRFAVGSAHRWYDKHSTEVKEKSSHCLSILEEAKTYQDKGLALFEESRRPGLRNEQRTALVKQANEQIRLRGGKLRAFTDCVNQAIRQQGPFSDTFASSGDAPPADTIQTHLEPPSFPPPDDTGGKGLKRVPGPPPKPPDPEPVSLNKAVDDCFSKKVPNYRSPDWSGFDPKSLRPKAVGQFAQSFTISGVAAEQALQLDELVYGKWEDRELMHDYLVGWLTHCLTDHHVLPMQDPRQPYRQSMQSGQGQAPPGQARMAERSSKFFYGYGSYPLPPFWDQDVAGPPSPDR